jgi:hypothetical protein
MAITQRHLIIITVSLLGGLISPARLHGQTESKEPVVFRTLAIGNPEALSGLFYEQKGRPVQVRAGSTSLSPAYVCPPGGHLVLYRELPATTPDGVPQRVRMAEADFGDQGPYLLVLAAKSSTAGSGATGVMALPVRDSWDTHPAESVRIFNFSRRRAAVKLEADTVELATAESHVMPFPANARIFDLKVAVWENNAWMLASSNPPAIIPRTRLLMVITDTPPSPYNPHPVEVDINAVYDDSPPPAPMKPGIAMQTTTRSQTR